MKFSRMAVLGAASLAVAQPHNHAHRHPARHGSPVEARDAAAATVTVPGPVETIYQLNGQTIPWSEVQAGIASGKYVLVGGQVQQAAAAPAPAASTPESSPVAAQAAPAAATSAPGGQFIEKAQSNSASSSSSNYVAPAAPASSSPASSAAAPVATVSSGSSSSSSSGSVGSWPDFPSGTLDCSTFPSEYGAVPADWLGLEGWTGVQNVPNFGGLGISNVISFIETAISGSGGCTAGSFCSYACPAGYQKSQWPSAQGNTGQSVGGVYCNPQGKLELSRSSVSQLCIPGTGGVNVHSTVGKNISICRTDYPGTESETVAMVVQSGETQPLTCPDANTYYFWEGKGTSAQYYFNPSGYGPSEACIWGTAGSNRGNWAPVNGGVGRGTDGTTFISIFQNAPTNPDGKLDYNIKITGDVSGQCSYSNGVFYNDGVVSSTGCTAGVTPGGTATFEFS